MSREINRLSAYLVFKSMFINGTHSTAFTLTCNGLENYVHEMDSACPHLPIAQDRPFSKSSFSTCSSYFI